MLNSHRFDRRAFILAGGMSYFGVDFAGRAAASPSRYNRQTTAKSTIMIWLSGGASHIDTWDMKPDAPEEYRGTFKPVATSAPASRYANTCRIWRKQAHHLAIVRSLAITVAAPAITTPATITTSPAMLPTERSISFSMPARPIRPTGRRWLRWSPSRGRRIRILPSAITLPQKEGAPEYTRPGQFAARLGIEYDPGVRGRHARTTARFRCAGAELCSGDIPADRLLDRHGLLKALDGAHRSADDSAPNRDYCTYQRKAFALLGSRQTKAAFDLRASRRNSATRYGKGINAMSMLMARRLVEAGVPFVTVFWKGDKELDTLCKSGGGWDTHGNNFNCLKDRLLPEFDRPFAALLDDLHQRGLLESTLVLVSSEMGRKPKIGDPRSGGVGGAGRDHWTACQSVLLAGGGIRGGQVFGTTDKRAEYPDQNPVAPEHIARTVFHAMGIDDLHAVDREGKPFHLMDEGRPLTELF